MQRREFITFIGSTVAWPLAARAQQPVMPVIGVLSVGPLIPDIEAAFERGLVERGYVVGKDVRIERRSAQGNYDRLPELVQGLVRLNPALIRVGGKCGCARRKASNFNHSHRIHHRVRPGEDWARAKLRSSRRQRHRHSYDDGNARPEAA
jgi:hypothetical protein